MEKTKDKDASAEPIPVAVVPPLVIPKGHPALLMSRRSPQAAQVLPPEVRAFLQQSPPVPMPQSPTKSAKSSDASKLTPTASSAASPHSPKQPPTPQDKYRVPAKSDDAIHNKDGSESDEDDANADLRAFNFGAK